MNNIIPFSAPNLNTGSQPPGTKKVTLHYSMSGRVICETEYRLANDTKFIELPIPVRHRLMMGH